MNSAKIRTAYWPYVLAFLVAESLALVPYYSQGGMVLGGEGNFFIDWLNYVELYTFSAWTPFYFMGTPNFSPGAAGFNSIIWMLIEQLTGSMAFTNYCVVLFLYSSHFLTMFWAGRELRLSPISTFLIATFYALNPFVLYYTEKMNQWNNPVLALMPLYFVVIHRFYHRRSVLFLVFGVVSALWSFANTNPPLMVASHISTLFAAALVVGLKEPKFSFTRWIGLWLQVLSSFVLFNMWWLLLTASHVRDGLKGYSQSFAVNWLTADTSPYDALEQTLSFTSLIHTNYKEFDFYTALHSTWYAQLITLIPLGVLVWGLFFVPLGKTWGRKTLAVFSVSLFFALLAKGVHPPFGAIYILFFKYVPLFSIFKTPIIKFGLVFVVWFSFGLILLYKGLESLPERRHLRKGQWALGIYIVFCMVPLLTGEMIPQSQFFDAGNTSRYYWDKQDFKATRHWLNRQESEFRVFRMPGMDYPIFRSKGEHLYSGIDPVLSNANKLILTPRERVPGLYYHFDDPRIVRYLGLLNVGALYLQKNFQTKYALPEKETVPELEEIFSSLAAQVFSGEISTLYRMPAESFQQRIFPAQSVKLLYPDNR